MAYEKSTGSPPDNSDKGILLFAQATASPPATSEGLHYALTQTLTGRLRVQSS